MGYNASYGLPYNEEMTRYECESKDGATENMFETDGFGNLYVKHEFAYCAECGAPLKGANTFVHLTKEICSKCELKHRMEQRKINKRTKKAVTL